MNARRAVCGRCRRVEQRRIARLRDDVAKLDQIVDILHDELDNATELCVILAEKLQELDPDFVDHMDDDEIAFWDAVAPFGAEDEGDDSPQV